MSDKKISFAYPNFDAYLPQNPIRDVSKWLETIKEANYLAYSTGKSKAAAIEEAIGGWDKMEQFDFKNWLKFYSEGAHNKYAVNDKASIVKNADPSYWENPELPGYFIPIGKDPEKPAAPKFDFNKAQDIANNEKVIAEKNTQAIEAQRKKIISRLDSIEKLLRSKEGVDVVGDESIQLIEIVHELKTKIYSIKKASRSNAIYHDMIIREANILNNSGFIKSAAALVNFAQEIPAAAPAASPLAGDGGQLGDLPGVGPGQVPPGTNTPDLTNMTPGPTPAAPAPTDQTSPGPIEPQKSPAVVLSPGMQGFLDGLDDVNLDLEDDASAAEENKADDGSAKVSTAQDAGADLKTPAAPEVAPEGEIAIKEDEPAHGSRFDDVIDAAFKDLKISDVVEKLEDLSKIFNTREVPRQLAIVDMMLDRLGLASFFPSLSEATNKSLESNNYVSTRIDDILSKLKGTIEGADLDLTNEKAVPSNDPQAAGVANKLKEQTDKDRAKKQLRKQVEDQALEQKLKPEATVENDLGEAPPAEATPASPVKPVGT